MENEQERIHDGPSSREGGGLNLAQVDPEEALETVRTVARKYPHAVVAGACAVGFVLGGGLTPRLLIAAGMLAARRYVAGNLSGRIEEFVGEQIGSLQKQQEEG